MDSLEEGKGGRACLDAKARASLCSPSGLGLRHGVPASNFGKDLFLFFTLVPRDFLTLVLFPTIGSILLRTGGCCGLQGDGNEGEEKIVSAFVVLDFAQTYSIFKVNFRVLEYFMEDYRNLLSLGFTVNLKYRMSKLFSIEKATSFASD